MSNKNEEVTYLDTQKSINQILELINRLFGKIINFIKNNFFKLLILFVIGLVLGFVKDKYDKRYVSTIIVIPNFNTVDFLYEKTALLEANLKGKNTAFFKKYQITPKGISKVSVKPIVDIYNLAKKNTNYYNIFKTLSQNSSANKVIKDYTTSKNFPKHLITIKSSTKITEEVTQGIMSFINKSDFYERSRKKILENLHNEIKVNSEVIKQIDAILDRVPQNNTTKSTVFFNENSELKDLVLQKLSLVNRNHDLKVHSDNLKYIVTPIGSFLNMKDSEGLNDKYKFVLPLVLVFCFILFSLMRKRFFRF